MLYARITQDGKRRETLIHHLEEVACLCSRACGRFGSSNMGNLIGWLHDEGKTPPSWQAYLLCSDPKEKLSHALSGARLLGTQATDGSLRCLTAQLAAAAIWGHHSGLQDMVTPEGEPRYEQRIFSESDDRDQEAHEIFFSQIASRKDFDSLFESATQEVQKVHQHLKKLSEKLFPDDQDLRARSTMVWLGLYQRLLFSCLVDSDRHAAASWEAEEEVMQEESNLPLWERMRDRLEWRLDALPQDKEINGARREISDACLQNRPTTPGVYRLNIPTGGGKTLASVRLALRLAQEQDLERILYCAPFTTILEQNARVLRDFLGNGECILEHHSNVIDETQHDKEEVSSQREHLAERYDAPIILTTQVQLMDCLFSGRTSAARRMHRLVRSVLIFDEIQSLPIKCTHLFNLAVQFLADFCGCTVILCTATQPAFEQVKYNLRLPECADLVDANSSRFPVFKRVIVKDFRSCNHTAESLSKWIVTLPETERSLLVVLNTKKAVRDVYLALKGKLPPDVTFFHLSTSMCPAHRLEKIKEMFSLLQATEKRPVVCVSTNLIEAGVDISFAGVVRALTGLDSAAQAAGRCNRHGELSEPGTLYLIRFDENKALSRLPDLDRAQRSTERVLEDLARGDLEGDMLSSACLERYYLYYYHQQRPFMDYILPTHSNNLIDLFSFPSGCDRVINQCLKKPHKGHTIMPQAFKTAGQHFCVIDRDSTGVIVPYRNGGDICQKIRTTYGFSDKKKLLRQAQLHSVNVFQNHIEDLFLCGAIRQEPKSGLWFLVQSELYDDSLGLTINSKKHVDDDDLIF